MDDFEVENERYEIDEIGDDEKYFFLTRISDGAVKQVFDISDELYKEVLDSADIPELFVIYKNGKFELEK